MEKVNQETDKDQYILKTKVRLLCQVGYSTLEKFPKAQRNLLTADIHHKLNDCLLNVENTYSYHHRDKRLYYLKTLYREVHYLSVLFIIAYNRRHISAKNLDVWAQRLTEIKKMTNKWISTLECDKPSKGRRNG